MTSRGWTGLVGARAFSSTAPAHQVLDRLRGASTPDEPGAQHVWLGPAVVLVQSAPSQAVPGPGHQRLPLPARSVDGRWVVLLDGSVSNHARLRAHLDYPFRTHDSAELVVAGLASEGISFVESLRGPFALVAHDLRADTTYLARDPMGVRPLHYRHLPGGIAFASDIKALLALGVAAPQVDHRSLDAYLALRAVPAPDTLFDGVKKVRPAHRVSIMPGGRIEDVAYWVPPEADPQGTWTPDDAIESVRDGVREAIVAAWGPDGHVGVHLDGRLGSSMVAAQARELRGDDPVHTFSLACGHPLVRRQPSCPQRLPDLLDTTHHEVHAEGEDLPHLMTTLTWWREAPLTDPTDLAHHVVARAAKDHVDVLAFGHGAEELFGGHPRYLLGRLVGLSPALPGPLRGLGDMAAGRHLGSSFSAAERKRLLGHAPPPDRAWPRPLGTDPVDRMMRHDLRHVLPDDLERLHRMTAAASLHAGLPMVEHRLVELALRLPTSFKVRSGCTSWVLREAARQLLPDEVIERRSGYASTCAGLGWWSVGAHVRERLTGADSWVAQQLDQSFVQELLAQHERGALGDTRLWTLFSLEVWHECFFASPPVVPLPRAGGATAAEPSPAR